MRALLIATALVMGVTLPSEARAIPETGTDILTNCPTSTDRPSRDKLPGWLDCISYANGFVEGLKLAGQKPGKPMVCLPENVSMLQLLIIAHKFVSDHPELMHRKASSLMAVSWVAAFPCPPLLDK